MRTAGAAVACSGLTVMIGLAGLAATPSLNVRSIGLGGGLVVLVGVGLALTLLPALLAILGPRVDAPAALRKHLARLDADDRWDRWSTWVCRHPLPLAAAGLIVLGGMCAPLAGLKTDFADADLLARHDLEFQRGMDILAGMGRGNAGAPVLVLATAQGPILDPPTMPALAALDKQLHADPRVQEVLGPLVVDPHKLSKKWRALRALAPSKFGAVLSTDEKSVLLTVVPRGDLRFEQVQALARDLGKVSAPGLAVEIGGQAALYNDVHYALMGSLPWLLAFVIGATFVVLALAYRSWLVPLKAIALNMLSVAAGYGALVVLFQWGWGGSFLGLEHGTGALPPAILATIFGIVFGLSMDYEVFLLARIKEGFDATHDNARAVREGLAATGGVITSAAFIMVTVFGAFAGVHLIMVKMLGVGLAIAVLVDATIVRVLLAPAIMTLAGDWNWHPGYKAVEHPAKGPTP
jgi:RND superfamily putative drug exporter